MHSKIPKFEENPFNNYYLNFINFLASITFAPKFGFSSSLKNWIFEFFIGNRFHPSFGDNLPTFFRRIRRWARAVRRVVAAGGSSPAVVPDPGWSVRPDTRPKDWREDGQGGGGTAGAGSRTCPQARPRSARHPKKVATDMRRRDMCGSDKHD